MIKTTESEGGGRWNPFLLSEPLWPICKLGGDLRQTTGGSCRHALTDKILWAVDTRDGEIERKYVSRNVSVPSVQDGMLPT